MSSDRDKALIQSVLNRMPSRNDADAKNRDAVHKILATALAAERAGFVNDVAAVLDADDVELFTALIMKAKQSPDLNSETRTALRSEAEIRADERAATWKAAIGLVKARLIVLQAQTAELSGTISGAACLGRDLAVEELVAALERAAGGK